MNQAFYFDQMENGEVDISKLLIGLQPIYGHLLTREALFQLLDKALCRHWRFS